MKRNSNADRERSAPPRRRQDKGSLSRRAALTAVLGMAAATRAIADDGELIKGEVVRRAPADLVRRSEQAVNAFMRGDVPGYLSHMTVADDFTLMQPLGGEVSRGFNSSPEWAKQIAEYFKDGEAKVELVQSYASGEEPGDIAVLATIEHQHGRVGGLPDQEWPLRVTLVFRRGAADWELVHRHADLTVRRISLEQAAMMARGEWPSSGNAETD